jgi:hypothetical protein
MKPHPAKYNKVLMPTIKEWTKGCPTVLDVFAGVGVINMPGGIYNEIEPEWVEQCPKPAIISDARKLPFADNTISAGATSPTFGSRMADHHTAKDKSKRHTYRHYIERPLHPSNSGQMNWGTPYRNLHRSAWYELYRVLEVGAPFVLNISDHYRAGVIVPVSSWHINTLIKTGFSLERIKQIPTPKQRHGANRHLRVPYELLVLFRK